MAPEDLLNRDVLPEDAREEIEVEITEHKRAKEASRANAQGPAAEGAERRGAGVDVRLWSRETITRPTRRESLQSGSLRRPDHLHGACTDPMAVAPWACLERIPQSGQSADDPFSTLEARPIREPGSARS